MFNTHAFPKLHARMEHFLKLNMRHEALGWCVSNVYELLSYSTRPRSLTPKLTRSLTQ